MSKNKKTTIKCTSARFLVIEDEEKLAEKAIIWKDDVQRLSPKSTSLVEAKKHLTRGLKYFNEYYYKYYQIQGLNKSLRAAEKVHNELRAFRRYLLQYHEKDKDYIDEWCEEDYTILELEQRLDEQSEETEESDDLENKPDEGEKGKPPEDSTSPFWTVVVALKETREEAEVYTSKLQSLGLEGAVLYSSDFSSLKPGYWVAYSGMFNNKEDAVEHSKNLKVHGFSDCYPRWIER